MKKRALAVMVPAVIICVTIFTAAAQQAANQTGGADFPRPDPTDIFDPASIPAGTYVVDPQHSALTGAVRHAGLSHFVFRFRRFDARFTYDPENPEIPNLEVTVDPSSIDTNVSGFDINIATSERRFNVSVFPEIKFVSNSLKFTGADRGVLEGNITFLGITKPLTFDITFLGLKNARNTSTIAFSATTTIRRSDFGFSDGSQNLADEVTISVEADFRKLPQ